MRRRVVILLVAAVLAGFSAVAVLAYARSADRRAVEGKQGVWVLLATGYIADGTTGLEIRAKRLARQVMMPAATVPDGALAKIDTKLDEMKLNAPLQPDQMLLERQFEVSGPPAPSLAPTFSLPPDKLAVSVELGIAPQVAGNVDPGDEVAVFATYPKRETSEVQQRTMVLLPKATVITVGERSADSTAPPISVSPSPLPSPGDEPTVIPSQSPKPETLERYVVTLAVDQNEAQLLIVGYNAGILHLGLLGANASASPSGAVSIGTATP